MSFDDDTQESATRLSTLLASIRRRGFTETVRLIVDELLFDRCGGYDTSGFIPIQKLDVTSPNRNQGLQYQGVPPRLLRKVFASLEFEYSNCDVVDFGCGKGRALLVAAKFGVRRLAGVEFSAELCEVARSNLQRYANRNGIALDFAILHMDATMYPIAPNHNVFFFYNPFRETVLVQVLDRIDKSLREQPRPALLIYVMPVHRQVTDDRYVPIREIDGEVVVYALGPTARTIDRNPIYRHGTEKWIETVRTPSRS